MKPRTIPYIFSWHSAGVWIYVTKWFWKWVTVAEWAPSDHGCVHQWLSPALCCPQLYTAAEPPPLTCIDSCGKASTKYSIPNSHPDFTKLVFCIQICITTVVMHSHQATLHRLQTKGHCLGEFWCCYIVRARNNTKQNIARGNIGPILLS